MGRTKNSITGHGYLGEIMVHRVTGRVGTVANVVEARDGWPPEITLKLENGSLVKGKLSEFKDASATEKQKFPQEPAAGAESAAPANT
jgi:hypothetical protein